MANCFPNELEKSFQLLGKNSVFMIGTLDIAFAIDNEAMAMKKKQQGAEIQFTNPHFTRHQLQIYPQKV